MQRQPKSQQRERQANRRPLEDSDTNQEDKVWQCAQFLDSWLDLHSHRCQALEIGERLRHLITQLDHLIKISSSAPNTGQLVSVKQAARLLGLSERTIRHRIATREWPAYRCGSAVRVDPLEIRTRMKRAG